MKNRIARSYHFPARFFFFLTFFIGVFTFRQYGLSWDEPIQRELGLATWDYVTGENDTLHKMINQYHNPGFELIEVLPEKLFQLKELSEVYYSRHAINFFIFWIGTIFFYLLAFRIFKNRWFALFAVAMLYLTPRIYAHSFYNSKDIPLLVFFIISSFYFLTFFEKPTYKNASILAAASGFLFGIRIIGVLIPVFVVGFFLLHYFLKKTPITHLKYLFAYLLLFLLFAYICYPVIWPDPIEKMKTAFELMGHYPYDDPVFFMGKLIRPQELPWYYIPLWMGITIPLVWQIMFAGGCIAIALRLIPSRKLWINEFPILFCVAWFLVPLLMVMLLHSPVYDEWRHLFFIYPAFLLIAMYGVQQLLSNEFFIYRRKKTLQYVFGIVITIQIGSLLYFMIRNHPHQYVYFNSLAGKEAGKRFDMDYWGLSYRAAFDYILTNDQSATLKVEWQNSPGQFNLVWLSEEDRKRIIHTPFDSCTYFLTNYRFQTIDPKSADKIYSLKVCGNEMMTVFKGPLK